VYFFRTFNQISVDVEECYLYSWGGFVNLRNEPARSYRKLCGKSWLTLQTFILEGVGSNLGHDTG